MLNAPGHRWLSIRLRGRPELGTNRDAIGASLLLSTSSGQRIWRVVQGSTGYLSAHPKEQHFGLGQDVPVTLTIRWPNGSEEIVSDLEPNQRYQIEQSSNR